MSVYFAEAGGYTKIGYSINPLNRAVTLTTNGKRPLDLPRGTYVDLIGWVPGDRWREGVFHAQLIEHRVAGEWFRRIDHDVIHELILADPSGVDLHRMSAYAVFYAIQHPGVSRDDIEAVGIRVAGNDEADSVANLFSKATS